MSELRVPFSELELHTEDEHINVTHRGMPFTGIALRETSETRYEDGYGHGRGTISYPDGTPREEFTLKHGLYAGERRAWYRSGQVEEHQRFDAPRFYRRWTEQGVLIEDYDESRHRHWYPDGVLREDMLEGGHLTVYTRAGELAFVRERSVKVGGIPFAPFRFDDAVMMAALEELAADPRLQHFVWMFVHQRLDRSSTLALDALRRLLAHPLADIACTALGNVSAAKVLVLRDVVWSMVDDERVPVDPENGARRGDRTVGDLARETLAKLR